MTDYNLTLRCANRSGIVAAVAVRIATHGGDTSRHISSTIRKPGCSSCGSPHDG